MMQLILLIYGTSTTTEGDNRCIVVLPFTIYKIKACPCKCPWVFMSVVMHFSYDVVTRKECIARGGVVSCISGHLIGLGSRLEVKIYILIYLLIFLYAVLYNQ